LNFVLEVELFSAFSFASEKFPECQILMESGTRSFHSDLPLVTLLCT